MHRHLTPTEFLSEICGMVQYSLAFSITKPILNSRAKTCVFISHQLCFPAGFHFLLRGTIFCFFKVSLFFYNHDVRGLFH